MTLTDPSTTPVVRLADTTETYRTAPAAHTSRHTRTHHAHTSRPKTCPKTRTHRRVLRRGAASSPARSFTRRRGPKTWRGSIFSDWKLQIDLGRGAGPGLPGIHTVQCGAGLFHETPRQTVAPGTEVPRQTVALDCTGHRSATPILALDCTGHRSAAPIRGTGIGVPRIRLALDCTEYWSATDQAGTGLHRVY